MNTIEKQKGLSGIAWLLIIVIAGIIAIMGIRLIPAYLGAMTVSSVMEGAARQPDANSAVEIRENLRKRLLINDIDYVKPRDFEITRESGSVVIMVEYERRVPFIGNIDFILSFKKREEVSRG